jgi:hypothetical protein
MAAGPDRSFGLLSYPGEDGIRLVDRTMLGSGGSSNASDEPLETIDGPHAPFD